MRFELDWCEDYLEYRQEKGLGEADPGLPLRLAALLEEYRQRVDHGQLSEASALVQWLAPPSCFVLRDPQDDFRYECIQSRDGELVRVVSGYAPEEVETEPREMPEVSDEILASVFADWSEASTSGNPGEAGPTAPAGVEPRRATAEPPWAGAAPKQAEPSACAPEAAAE